jgi:uncharacterized protein YutE (UPF0331/DUF86 family)
MSADHDLVAAKLTSLERCLQRVEDRCPATREELAADDDLQDIVSVNLERAVQLCVDVANHIAATAGQPAPATMGQAFDSLATMDLIPEALAGRLCRAVGFRNIAVHQYDRLDWAIVFAIATEHLGDFRAFRDAVIRATMPDDTAG